MVELVVLILLVLFLIGGLPAWGWHHYGYAPSGGLLLVVVIVLIYFGATRWRAP